LDQTLPLDRDFAGRSSATMLRREELVAEIGRFLCCDLASPEPRRHAAISTLAQVLKEDRRAISSSRSCQRAVDFQHGSSQQRYRTCQRGSRSIIAQAKIHGGSMTTIESLTDKALDLWQ